MVVDRWWVRSRRTPRRLAVLLGCVGLLGVGSVGCRSPYYQDHGAGLGALAGAGLGAAIGAHNGNPLAGAAIGAAAGGLTGAAVGNSIDQDVENNNLRAELARRQSRAVSIPDVMSMVQAGTPEDVIIAQVNAGGMDRPLTTDDVIALTRAGVSPNLIKAMQYARPATAVAVGPGVRPVIVEEHVLVSPWGPPPPPVFYRPYYHRPPPRVGWGVSVGF